MLTQIEIRPFDRMAADDSEYNSLTELQNIISAEAKPEDPPTTMDDMRKQMHNIPPVFDVTMWAGWDADRMAAFALCGIPRMENNQHLVQLEISVLPEYRRHKVATRFLPAMVELAEKEGRRLFISNTHSTVPAGEKFMEALSAEVGLSMRRNDLEVKDLDRDLIADWIARAKERATGFEIVEYLGPYPEDVLPKISEVQKAINAMPTDNLDIEDFEFTPEHLKQMDDALVATGRERWSLVAVESATGNFAGWTDLTFNPIKPNVCDVGGTAVSKDYQNLGIGRWLKAAILDKLLKEKPNVEVVRTGNAHSNAPMLKINDELGFMPALTINLWQVEVDKVKEYLAAKSETVSA